MKSCVSCGSQDLVHQGKYHYYYSSIFDEKFPNLEELCCLDCHLYQVDHSLVTENSLTNYYENHYRQTVNIARSDGGATAVLNARGLSLASLCFKYKPIETVKRIFELGAGYGFNLLQFGQLYSRASLHSDDLNTDFLPEEIILAKVEDGPYDIAILSHVLEHFIYPIALVQKVVDNLADDGVLVVEVPNEGGGFLFQQEGGVPYHEPHLTFFHIGSLEAFFTKNFSELSIVYKGTAGTNISDEKRRRLNLISGTRGITRRLFKLYPPFFKFAQGLFNRLNKNSQQQPIDFSDHSEDEDRLYLRMILKKV